MPDLLLTHSALCQLSVLPLLCSHTQNTTADSYYGIVLITTHTHYWVDLTGFTKLADSQRGGLSQGSEARIQANNLHVDVLRRTAALQIQQFAVHQPHSLNDPIQTRAAQHLRCHEPSTDTGISDMLLSRQPDPQSLTLSMLHTFLAWAAPKQPPIAGSGSVML